MNITLQKDSVSGKWIVKLDATSLRTSSCIRKFWLTNCCGWRNEFNHSDLEFGSAFHIFARHLPLVSDIKDLITIAIPPAIKYFSETKMLEKDKKGFLTAEYLQQTCYHYYEKVWKQDRFKIANIQGNWLVEQDFAILIHSTDIADYLLTGTIDKIGQFDRGGPVCISDYKTTGKYAKNAKAYFDSFELSNQLLCYRLAVDLIKEQYPEGQLGKLFDNKIGCFIDGIFVPSGVTIEFDRSRTFFFTKQQIEEFHELLLKFIERLDIVLNDSFIEGFIPIREGIFNGSCNSGYSPCIFFGACASPDDVSFERILKNNLVQKLYDPLTFGKE